MMEAVFPSPPVLYPGRTLPLNLLIRCLPIRLGGFIPIRLRKLAISLRSTTAITAGVRHTSWTSSRVLLDLHGLDEPVRCHSKADSFTEIDSNIFGNVIIPEAAPSFSTRTVEQKYLLEVKAAFTLGSAGKLSVSSCTPLALERC
ncbi:hypothetical protein BDW66DRAFT_57511 [Aspergillus desertorum]